MTMIMDGAGGYPDERMSGLGGGGMSGIVYLPDLGPVGSGSGGTYYPRDTMQDAIALNFLGHFPDALLAEHVGTTGSQKGDMAAYAGAWSPAFQAAVRDFQGFNGLGVDGWIGPGTRKKLGELVNAKNLKELPIPPAPSPNILPIPPAPYPLPPGPLPPNVIPPGPGPSPTPASAKPDHTMRNVGIGVGVLVAGGLAWALFSD